MLKIYGVPISVHTRKVIVAARMKRLPSKTKFPSIPPRASHWRCEVIGESKRRGRLLLECQLGMVEHLDGATLGRITRYGP